MSDTSLPEQSRVRLLVRHGSTIVYCGRLPRAGREVILKICFTPFITPLQLQQTYVRLRQEVSRLHTLKNPHILTPLMVRKTVQGFVFVSTYASAGSLQQFLHEPMLPARALAIIRQIGEALQAAHQRGIVHGNLMPNNVLFLQRAAEIDAEHITDNKDQPTTLEQKDQVAITDFYLPSLASAQAMNTSNEQPQLRHYMAPEQFQGERSALADQYSLAAIAYELLTGKTPFAGSARTTLQHKHEYVLPPAPDQLNPALPAAIAHAISKALAKNPAERFASIQDFLAALEPAALAAAEAPPAPVETKEAILRAPLVAPVAAGQPENVIRQRGTRKRLRLAAILLVLLLAASAVYASTLYIPLFGGATTGKMDSTATITTNPTTATQQARIGIAATQDDTKKATPVVGVTPGTTPTSQLLPTATANVNLQQQATPSPQASATPTSTPGNTSPAQGTVKPILECVHQQGASGYTARFGYLNTSSSTVTIPVGVNNMISPSQYNSSLPTSFLPGQQDSVMQINVSNNTALVWMLNGSTVTASSASPRC